MADEQLEKSQDNFETYEEFWPHYLSEHSNPKTRQVLITNTTYVKAPLPSCGWCFGQAVYHAGLVANSITSLGCQPLYVYLIGNTASKITLVTWLQCRAGSCTTWVVDLL